MILQLFTVERYRDTKLGFVWRNKLYASIFRDFWPRDVSGVLHIGIRDRVLEFSRSK